MFFLNGCWVNRRCKNMEQINNNQFYKINYSCFIHFRVHPKEKWNN